MSNTVIKAEHLSKMYRLGVINNGTLWKDMQTWVALKMGKEDPHSKIGEDKYAGDEDHFWALKDLNFEIQQGDRVGIIGKNGAGKSTLLKILSRITAPTEGSVKIKGKVASLLEVGTGFHGELTGRENIYLNGAILGMKKRRIDKKLDEIIAFSGIEHHIDTPVKRYSSGMYVRLAFAVAAHLDSDILIADEVLAVGDAEFQKKALGKMESLSTGEGRTVLFVSHNISAVSNLCTTGIVLEAGRIKNISDIQTSVNFYKQAPSLQTSKCFWEGMEGDDNLKITKVMFLKNNKLSDVFHRGEKFELIIEYSILRFNHNYTFSVELINKDGNIICESSLTDDCYREYDKLTSVGNHEARLLIDTQYIAQGTYSLMFDFAIRNQKRITKSTPVLFFHIHEASNDQIYTPKRINTILLPWNWFHSQPSTVSSV